MKKASKILSLILAIALCFTIAAPRAHAITGVAIAGTIVITLAVVVSIALIAATSSGLQPAIVAAASDQGIGSRDLMSNLIQQYLSHRHMRVTEMLTIFSAGVYYAATGQLSFDAEVSSFFTDFFDWAYSSAGGNLQEYDTASTGGLTVDISGINGSGYDFSKISSLKVDTNILYWTNTLNQTPEMIVTSSSSTVFCCFIKFNDNTNYFPYFVSENPFVVRYKYNNANDLTQDFNSSRETFYTQDGGNGEYYYYRANMVTISSSYVLHSPISYLDCPKSDWTIHKSLPVVSYAVLYGAKSGDGSYIDDAWTLPAPSNGTYVNEMDPADVIGMQGVVEGTADVQGYIDSLVDSMYLDGGTLTVEDAQGIETEVELTYDDAQVLELEKVLTQDLDITYEQVGTQTATGPLTDYQIDLRDFFPFCIPFDIYDMLSLFSSAAEAPRIEWRIYAPNVVDETVVLDFSSFDTVAAILRNLELIAFAIFLAANTKKLIMGS